MVERSMQQVWADDKLPADGAPSAPTTNQQQEASLFRPSEVLFGDDKNTKAVATTNKDPMATNQNVVVVAGEVKQNGRKEGTSDTNGESKKPASSDDSSTAVMETTNLDKNWGSSSLKGSTTAIQPTPTIGSSHEKVGTSSKLASESLNTETRATPAVVENNTGDGRENDQQSSHTDPTEAPSTSNKSDEADPKTESEKEDTDTDDETETDTDDEPFEPAKDSFSDDNFDNLPFTNKDVLLLPRRKPKNRFGAWVMKKAIKHEGNLLFKKELEERCPTFEEADDQMGMNLVKDAVYDQIGKNGGRFMKMDDRGTLHVLTRREAMHVIHYRFHNEKKVRQIKGLSTPSKRTTPSSSRPAKPPGKRTPGKERGWRRKLVQPKRQKRRRQPKRQKKEPPPEDEDAQDNDSVMDKGAAAAEDTSAAQGPPGAMKFHVSDVLFVSKKLSITDADLAKAYAAQLKNGGNEIMRKLILKHFDAHQAAGNRSETRKRIVDEIISQVTGNGGRFLRMTRDERWEEMSEVDVTGNISTRFSRMKRRRRELKEKGEEVPRDMEVDETTEEQGELSSRATASSAKHGLPAEPNEGSTTEPAAKKHKVADDVSSPSAVTIQNESTPLAEPTNHKLVGDEPKNESSPSVASGRSQSPTQLVASEHSVAVDIKSPAAGSTPNQSTPPPESTKHKVTVDDSKNESSPSVVSVRTESTTPSAVANHDVGAAGRSVVSVPSPSKPAAQATKNKVAVDEPMNESSPSVGSVRDNSTTQPSATKHNAGFASPSVVSVSNQSTPAAEATKHNKVALGKSRNESSPSVMLVRTESTTHTAVSKDNENLASPSVVSVLNPSTPTVKAAKNAVAVNETTQKNPAVLLATKHNVAVASPSAASLPNQSTFEATNHEAAVNEAEKEISSSAASVRNQSAASPPATKHNVAVANPPAASLPKQSATLSTKHPKVAVKEPKHESSPTLASMQREAAKHNVAVDESNTEKGSFVELDRSAKQLGATKLELPVDKPEIETSPSLASVLPSQSTTQSEAKKHNKVDIDKSMIGTSGSGVSDVASPTTSSSGRSSTQSTAKKHKLAADESKTGTSLSVVASLQKQFTAQPAAKKRKVVGQDNRGGTADFSSLVPIAPRPTEIENKANLTAKRNQSISKKSSGHEKDLFVATQTQGNSILGAALKTQVLQYHENSAGAEKAQTSIPDSQTVPVPPAVPFALPKQQGENGQNDLLSQLSQYFESQARSRNIPASVITRPQGLGRLGTLATAPPGPVGQEPAVVHGFGKSGLGRLANLSTAPSGPVGQEPAVLHGFGRPGDAGKAVTHPIYQAVMAPKRQENGRVNLLSRVPEHFESQARPKSIAMAPNNANEVSQKQSLAPQTVGRQDMLLATLSKPAVEGAAVALGKGKTGGQSQAPMQQSVHPTYQAVLVPPVPGSRPSIWNGQVGMSYHGSQNLASQARSRNVDLSGAANLPTQPARPEWLGLFGRFDRIQGTLSDPTEGALGDTQAVRKQTSTQKATNPTQQDAHPPPPTEPKANGQVDPMADIPLNLESKPNTENPSASVGPSVSAGSEAKERQIVPPPPPTKPKADRQVVPFADIPQNLESTSNTGHTSASVASVSGGSEPKERPLVPPPPPTKPKADGQLVPFSDIPENLESTSNTGHTSASVASVSGGSETKERPIVPPPPPAQPKADGQVVPFTDIPENLESKSTTTSASVDGVSGGSEPKERPIVPPPPPPKPKADGQVVPLADILENLELKSNTGHTSASVGPSVSGGSEPKERPTPQTRKPGGSLATLSKPADNVRATTQEGLASQVSQKSQAADAAHSGLPTSATSTEKTTVRSVGAEDGGPPVDATNTEARRVAPTYDNVLRTFFNELFDNEDEIGCGCRVYQTFIKGLNKGFVSDKKTGDRLNALLGSVAQVAASTSAANNTKVVSVQDSSVQTEVCIEESNQKTKVGNLRRLVDEHSAGQLLTIAEAAKRVASTERLEYRALDECLAANTPSESTTRFRIMEIVDQRPSGLQQHFLRGTIVETNGGDKQFQFVARIRDQHGVEIDALMNHASGESMFNSCFPLADESTEVDHCDWETAEDETYITVDDVWDSSEKDGRKAMASVLEATQWWSGLISGVTMDGAKYFCITSLFPATEPHS